MSRISPCRDCTRQGFPGSFVLVAGDGEDAAEKADACCPLEDSDVPETVLEVAEIADGCLEGWNFLRKTDVGCWRMYSDSPESGVVEFAEVEFAEVAEFAENFQVCWKFLGMMALVAIP